MTPLYRLNVPLALTLAMTLAACATGAPAATPSPPPPPTATLAPTAAPTPPPLSLADRQPYMHPSGAFALSIPVGWELRDNSQPDELILIWSDPGRSGAVVVNLFDADQPYATEQLGAILSSYLERSFGKERDFAAAAPEPDSPDGLWAIWGFTRALADDRLALLAGRSRIIQRETRVAIVSILLPADQAEGMAEAAGQIAGSLSVDADAPIVR